MTSVTVALPGQLRVLAGIEGGSVTVEVDEQPSIATVLDAVEAAYPVLRGTIRDHGTLKRRAFVRFFACERDLSHDPPDTLLPAEVADGREVFRVVGAIAGG